MYSDLFHGIAKVTSRSSPTNREVDEILHFLRRGDCNSLALDDLAFPTRHFVLKDADIRRQYRSYAYNVDEHLGADCVPGVELPVAVTNVWLPLIWLIQRHRAKDLPLADIGEIAMYGAASDQTIERPDAWLVSEFVHDALDELDGKAKRRHGGRKQSLHESR